MSQDDTLPGLLQDLAAAMSLDVDGHGVKDHF